MASKLRVHWSLPLDSGQRSASSGFDAGCVDVDAMVRFARDAEALGIDSLLMPMSVYMPDPVPLLGALVRETRRVKFILAYRPGLVAPTLLAQILNTLSWMSKGRVDLNLVAGISPKEQAQYGDHLTHDARYDRAEEFLRVMHGLWRGDGPVSLRGRHHHVVDAQLGLAPHEGVRPRVYVSGASPLAQRMAAERADCWLTYGNTPDAVGREARLVREAGRGVGLRMHVIARETRDEALQVIDSMMRSPDEAHRAFIAGFVAHCDSQAVRGSFAFAEAHPDDWPLPWLWTGAVPYRGGPAVAIVGSHAEVAAALAAYEARGVTDFILSGWPSHEELRHFGHGVLPRLAA